MFLTWWGTLANCPCQEETRDERVPVAATGSRSLVGKLVAEYPNWSGCQSQWRRDPTRVAICCRKGDPFQDPKVGFCPTLGNELSKKTHVLRKQEILLGRESWVETSRVREPRRTALPHGLMVIGLVSGLSLANHSESWWHMHLSAQMDASEKDSGRWSDVWCLLLTFPELFQLVVVY